MKKTTFYGLMTLTALTIASCSPENDGAETSPSQVAYQTLSLNFFESSIDPFGSSASSRTRADDNTLAKSFNRLDVALFPQFVTNNDTVYRYSQLSTDDGYGSLTVKVPVGAYKLVGVANQKSPSVAATIHRVDSVSFESNKVGDVACVSKDVTVAADNSTVTSCQLKRAVTLFRLKEADVLSSEIAKIKVTVEGRCGYKLNPSTGYSLNSSTSVNKTFNTTSLTEATRKSYVIDFYMFLGSDTQTVSVKMELYGDTDMKNLLKSYTFSDVTLKVNYITTYTGNFLTAQNASSFTFSDGEMTSSGYDKTF